MRLAVYSWLCASLLAAPCARAEEHAVQLEYRAPTECPTAARFEAAVRTLVPGLELVPDGDVPRFLVEIAADGRSGSLVAGGGVRQTAGENCQEVAGFLAFSVALAIDPDVQMSEDPKLPEAEAEPTEATPAPRVEPVAAPSSQAATHWGVGGFGQVNSALAPRGVWGGGIAIDAFPELFGAERWFRFGLGRSYGLSSVVVDGARVDFSTWLAQVEGCPVAWRRAWLRLGACARLESGIKTATARDIPQGREATRPWLALGPVLRLRARFAGPLFVDAGAGLSLPLIRDHVFLQPNSTVHQVPRLGGLAELSLGVEFGDQAGG